MDGEDRSRKKEKVARAERKSLEVEREDNKREGSSVDGAAKVRGEMRRKRGNEILA